MSVQKTVLILTLCILCASAVTARDIWVDNSCPPGGNGNTEVCGSNGPYNDLQDALSIVQPGDTVLIKNGTGAYVTNNLGTYNPNVPRYDSHIDGGFTVRAQGGANPVTITSAPGHFPILANCGVNQYNTYCLNPTFVASTDGVGRIIFDRIQVQGGIIIRGSVSVINSRISKGYEPIGPGTGDGNLGAIKVMNTINWNPAIIRNNYFHDLYRPTENRPDPENLPYTNAWIYLFRSPNTLIEYNTFEGFMLPERHGQGAALDKHSESPGSVFRYNLVIDGRGSFFGHLSEVQSYGNVIHCGDQQGGRGIELNAGSVYHNTIVNCQQGMHVHPEFGPRAEYTHPDGEPQRPARVYNNVYANIFGGNVGFRDIRDTTREDFFSGIEHVDFNVYTPSRLYAWYHAHYGLSFSQWRTQFGLDQNSVETACQFRDPANHDYRLVAGSNCMSLGRSGGVSSGTPVQVGAFAVTDCVGHLCSPGSSFIPYDPSWRTQGGSHEVSPPPPAEDPRPGDFTDDGEVGLADLLYVVGLLGLTTVDAGFDASADMNGDGVIDLFDLVFVARLFGT